MNAKRIYVMKETPLHCNLQRYRYLFILFELCIADEAVVEGHLVSAVEPDYPVGVQVVVVQLTLYKSVLRIRIILFEDPFRLFFIPLFGSLINISPFYFIDISL